jgi:hypothetical protein
MTTQWDLPYQISTGSTQVLFFDVVLNTRTFELAIVGNFGTQPVYYSTFARCQALGLLGAIIDHEWELEGYPSNKQAVFHVYRGYCLDYGETIISVNNIGSAIASPSDFGSS